MRQTESFKKEKIVDNPKILIYGAAVYGEIALRGLEILGLKPECFIDREHVGEEYLGYRIISPNDLNGYKDAVVIIASLNYFGEILEYLKGQKISRYYDMEDIMHLDYSHLELSEYALEEVQHYEKYLTTIENCQADALVINHCEIVVTEKCTLRCRDCANLMQYYKKPMDIEIKNIIQDFNRFIQVIDVLCELRILGGEPFICRELGKLIKEYAECEKIKRITIYTNATLIPDQNTIEALMHEKVAVHLSNYGTCSGKIELLERIFTEKNIIFYTHKYEKWRNFGGVEKRNYTKEQLNRLYQTCSSGKCYTFYRGKLYLCPRAAHGEQLGIFQNRKCEYIDFSNECSETEKRKELKNLLSEVKTLTACDYCNGESVYSEEIDAAVQMKG